MGRQAPPMSARGPSRHFAPPHDFGRKQGIAQVDGQPSVAESDANDPKRTSDSPSSLSFTQQYPLASFLGTLSTWRSWRPGGAIPGGTFGVHVLKCQYFVASDQCSLHVMGTFPCQDNDRRTQVSGLNGRIDAFGQRLTPIETIK